MKILKGSSTLSSLFECMTAIDKNKVTVLFCFVLEVTSCCRPWTMLILGKPGRIQRYPYKIDQSELILWKSTGSDGSSDLCLYGDCSRLLKYPQYLHQSLSCFQTVSLQILQYWLHRADFLLIVLLFRLSWVLSKEKSLYLSILLAEWNKWEWCLQL